MYHLRLQIEKGKPDFSSSFEKGRIHCNQVTDGWAKAVMLKSLAIQKCYGQRDGPRDPRARQHDKVKSRVFAIKKSNYTIT